MDNQSVENVLNTGLTASVVATYQALWDGFSVTSDGVTFAVQTLSLTGGVSGTTANYTDTFLWGVSDSAGTISGQATATIAANITSADHGTLDVALDLTSTPAAQATVAALIIGAMEHEGFGSMVPGNPTISNNSVTYTWGVQDAGHTHADLIATLNSANSISLHADYHLVV